MNAIRPLMIEASKYDIQDLLEDWHWLVPPTDTPLFLSALGDWVFRKPNGSLWVLFATEGSYELAAKNSTEYNSLKQSADWLDETFLAGWLPIAADHGLKPTKDECLGWKIPPVIGGKFEVANLQVFSMSVYQTVMGQIHRQLQQQAPIPPAKKPWYKFW